MFMSLLVNQLSPQKALICDVFQFLRYKDFNDGWFRGTKMMSLKGIGKDAWQQTPATALFYIE